MSTTGPTAVAAAVGVGRTIPCNGGCAGTGRVTWRRCGPIGGAVRGPSKPSFLMPAQEQQVVAAAAQRVFGTAQAVRDWIEDQFGVVYTVGSLYTLLSRLRIRLKVLWPRHMQAAPQA